MQDLTSTLAAATLLVCATVYAEQTYQTQAAPVDVHIDRAAVVRTALKAGRLMEGPAQHCIDQTVATPVSSAERGDQAALADLACSGDLQLTELG